MPRISMIVVVSAFVGASAAAVSSVAESVPDNRLKWLGSGKVISVSGDWLAWSRAGVSMVRDEDGAFAADIFLPEACPRSNLVMSGVCCYHYKFFVDFGNGHSRWLHDPKQPMDRDPDGRVNNFMCKYARAPDGQMQKSELPQDRVVATVHTPSASGKGRVDAASATGEGEATDGREAAAQPSCLILPATLFNGTTTGSTSTRSV